MHHIRCPRYLWPLDHQRSGLPFRDEELVTKAQRTIDGHLAQGAPRDLGGYLRWLREKCRDTSDPDEDIFQGK